MSGRYNLAYKRFSVHKFKDVCLGKEREFELKVDGSIKIGDHKLAIAYECDENVRNCRFKYIILDDYIYSCSLDGCRLRSEFLRLIKKYKRMDGHHFKNDLCGITSDKKRIYYR